MGDRGNWATGLRMVIAASVSAVVVAALVIVVGRTLITEPASQPPTNATLVMVSR